MLHGLGPVHVTAHSIMNGSRVAQSLDSLWFYTNIMTHVPSLTHQFEPLIHAKECPKSVLHNPDTPFLVNQQLESQNVETLTPMCHKFGGISSACEEVRGTVQGSSKKRERRKRNKFDVKEVSGFLKFKEESYKYHMLNNQQDQTKMPPFDDDAAMKQHLKSWAYEVACTVR